EGQRVIMGLISSDYLRTLGIPLKRGRPLDPAEIEHLDRVSLINEAAVKLWGAGQDPIGKRISLDLLTKPGDDRVLVPPGSTSAVRIVGIIGDTKNNGLRDAPIPAVFVPYTLL